MKNSLKQIPYVFTGILSLLFVSFTIIMGYIYNKFQYLTLNNDKTHLISHKNDIDIYLGVGIFVIAIFILIGFVYLIYSSKHIEKVTNEFFENINCINENEKELQSQLQRKNNYLRQYHNMIDKTEAVLRFDIFGNITSTNENFCKLSKYDRDEIIGKPIVDFIDSNEGGFYSQITKVIKEGDIYNGINSDKAKDGSIYTTRTSIFPIKVDDIIQDFFCIRTNITPIIELNNEIIETQKDIISTMGEIGESRCKETSFHVKRVAEYSKTLGIKYGLDKKECELLYYASPMHDIGKVGISDEILKKPAKLTSDEYEVMKNHTTLGYEMLKHSNRDILKAAAIIAHEHHEKWDGTGYPNQKKAYDIHIFGRITAIADIFDALGSDRVYKKAWEMSSIIKLLIDEKEKHFDPELVDIFLDNLDEFLLIREKYKDITFEQ